MCSTRNVSRNGSCSTISTAPSVTERITSVSNVRLLVTGYGWYECFCLLFGFIGFIFMRWWSSIFWVWRGAFFLFFCFLYDGIIVMIDEIYASQWILECLWTDYFSEVIEVGYWLVWQCQPGMERWGRQGTTTLVHGKLKWETLRPSAWNAVYFQGPLTWFYSALPASPSLQVNHIQHTSK